MNTKIQKAVDQIRTFTLEEREEFLAWLAEDERLRDSREILKRKLDEALTEEPTDWIPQDLEAIRRDGKALAEKRRAARA